MDVKSRRNAERKNKMDRTSDFTRVSNCPFCGEGVTTHVAQSGTRFFDCTMCGASVTFRGCDQERAIDRWEDRVGEREENK